MKFSIRSYKTLAVSFLILLAIIYVCLMVSKYWGKLCIDFPTFYYAAKLVFVEKLPPYSPKNWEVVKNLFSSSKDLWPYLYLPPTLLLFWPLLYLDIVTASKILLILNLGLTILFGFLVLYKKINHKVSVFLLLASIYLFFYYPLQRTLATGQINLFVLIALCLMWLGLKEDWHPGFVGFFLVIAILLKIYPAVFLLYLFIKKKTRILFWSLGILIVFFLLSIIFLPDGIWIDWFQTVAMPGYGERIANKLHPGSAANQSLNGFYSRFFLGKGKAIDSLALKFLKPWQIEKANKIAIYVSVLILTGISFILIWVNNLSTRDKGSDLLSLEFSILLLLQLMISPFSWKHHLVIVLPALLFAALYNLKKGTPWVTRLLTLVCLLVLAAKIDFNNPKWFAGWATLVISIKLYAVVILWGIFAFMLWQSRKTAAGSNNVSLLSNL